MIARHTREVRQEPGHLGLSAPERYTFTQPRHADTVNRLDAVARVD